MDLKLPGIKTTDNAPLFRRALAFIIDLFIIEFVIASPFNKALDRYITGGSFLELFDRMMADTNVLARLYPILIIVTALMIAYFAIFELRYGQTIGKMVLKIRVISLADELSLGQAIVRALFLIPIAPLNLIDILYAFFNQDGQRILEHISRTKVIIA